MTAFRFTSILIVYVKKNFFYLFCYKFEDENRIFGQTIWLLNSFLENYNTISLISPEREGLYLCFTGNIN